MKQSPIGRYGIAAGSLAVAGTAAFAVWGCGGPAAGPVSPAIVVQTDPVTASQTQPAATQPAIAYADAKDEFRLVIPAGWKQKPGDEYTLMLVPADGPARTRKDADLDGRKMSVDVPGLPPHLPGMITLGPMEWHYVDDEKGRFTDMKVTEKKDLAWAGAKARRLVMNGHAKKADGTAGAAYTEVTLLEIHNDRVYLVSAEAPDEQYPAVRADFDKLVNSMQWSK